MPVDRPEPAPRGVPPGFFIGWAWAVLMAAVALGSFVSGRPTTGVLALLSGLVALPPAGDFIAQHWHSDHSEWIRLAIIGVLLFPMAATVADVKAVPAKAGDPPPTAGDASIPGDLAHLAHVVAKAKSDYTEADNDLKKSVIRRERDASAFAAVPGGNFSNWPGTLEELSTNNDGDAYITVKLDDCDCSVKTWNTPYPDTQDHSLIKMGTPLFNKLLNMYKGDHVIVSGHMLEEEDSIMEDRSINDPQWISRFSDVSPG